MDSAEQPGRTSLGAAAADEIKTHIRALAAEIGPRPTGSAANRAAGDYIAAAFAQSGYEPRKQGFACLDWSPGASSLSRNGRTMTLCAHPFSPPAEITAPTALFGDLPSLEKASLRDRICVLHGELAAEPLFPKRFPFFNLPHHQRIVELLEAKQPLAAVFIRPGDAAAPLMEDGDFSIPSATAPAAALPLLREENGTGTTVKIAGTTSPSSGFNVLARRPGKGRTVVCAHYDTKPDTPGAVDNAGGVAALLALASRFARSPLETAVEFVAFNGEDYYAASGEVAYLASTDIRDVSLVFNIDGVGGARRAALASFNLGGAAARKLKTLLPEHSALVETGLWPEGDHTIFAAAGVPGMAFTSEGIHSLLGNLIHTPADRPERVRLPVLGAVVAFIASFLGDSGGGRK